MKVSLAQINNGTDIMGNLNKIKQMITTCESKVMVFPECALTGYSEKAKALDLHDPVLKDLLTLCSKEDKHVFMGLKLKEDEKTYIAHCHIYKTVKVYKKCHLGSKEMKTYTPGNQLEIFDVEGLKVGVAICIESHIPDISQTLRLRGADMVIMPFASPKVCGSRKSLWQKYLPARAYDNCFYLVACNLTGHLGDLEFPGGLMAFDFKGQALVDYHESDECFKTFHLDKNALDKRRMNKKIDYINRRRPELYGKE